MLGKRVHKTNGTWPWPARSFPFEILYQSEHTNQHLCRKVDWWYPGDVPVLWEHQGSSRPTETRFAFTALPSAHTNTLWPAGIPAEAAILYPPCTEFVHNLRLFTFNVLFKVRILWSFSFMDGFLHRFTKDFINSFLVEGRRSPRGDRLACSNDL